MAFDLLSRLNPLSWRKPAGRKRVLPSSGLASRPSSVKSRGGARKLSRAKRIVDLRKVVRRVDRPAVSSRVTSSVPATAQRLGHVGKPGVLGFFRRKKNKAPVGRIVRISRFRAFFRSDRVRLMFLTVACLIAATGFVFALFVSPFFRIERLVLRGDLRLSDAQLKAAADPVLTRQFFGLHADNIFLLPAKDLEAALAASDPRIASVRVTKKYPTVLAFDLTQRRIAAVWLSGRQAYFLDADGVACCEASLDALLAQDLPRMVDLSVHPVEPGNEATLPRHINYAVQLSELFRRSLPMQIARFELPSAKAEEMHVVTVEGVRFLFSLQRPAEPQVEKLQRILQDEIKERYPLLQYVDLRVEGYAYYK